MEEINMKKLILCSLTGSLLLGAIVPTATVLASEKDGNYSKDGNLKIAEVINENASASDFEIISIIDHPVETKDGNDSLIKPYVIINDGGYSWTRINTRYYSDALSNSIVYNTSNYLVNIVLTYFGSKIIKSAVQLSDFMSALASSSVANVTNILSQPATVYYTVTTYEDYDSVNYYVKQNIKIYSDSSRTKVVSNSNVVSRFTRN